MVKITVKDLENNIDKYIALGQKEEIIVTLRGSQIFTIVPKKVEFKKRWELLFGTLPPEASNDNDIDRE